MAIDPSELKFYKSITVDDTDANGGRLSANELTGVENELWEDALEGERYDGSEKFRKIFGKIANIDDSVLESPQFWLELPTGGEDWVTFFSATQRGTQTTISGTVISGTHYGVGYLFNTIPAGTLTTQVMLANSTLKSGGSYPIFRSGSSVRITDQPHPTASGNEEFLTVQTVNNVGETNRVAITFTTPTIYPYSTTSGARVMSIYKPPATTASGGITSTTSSGGSFNEVGYPVVFNNIGTSEEDWDFDFETDTQFVAVGTTNSGTLYSGTVNSDFSPMNPDFSVPFFTMPSGIWDGTWKTGDKATLTSHPSAIPIWEMRTVPPGCGTRSLNNIRLVFTGTTVS